MIALLLALGETIWDTIKETADKHRAMAEKRRYENIDFDNIELVTLDYTDTAYRTETREEFDIVSTYATTQRTGRQHYKTKTVEYEVEDGEDYCFTIRYKDGTEIQRKFHESSPITRRLLKYIQKDVEKAYAEVMDALDGVVSTIGNMFGSSSEDEKDEEDEEDEEV